MGYRFNCKVCGEEITTKFLKIGEPAKCKGCDALTKVPKKAKVIDDSEVTYETPLPDVLETGDDVSGMEVVVAGSLTVFKGDNLIVVRGQSDLTKPKDDVMFYKFIDGLMSKGYKLLNTTFNLTHGISATLVKPMRPTTD